MKKSLNMNTIKTGKTEPSGRRVVSPLDFTHLPQDQWERVGWESKNEKIKGETE